VNPFLENSLASFAAASAPTTDQDGPMTSDEAKFLLNDSIIRMPTPKQTAEHAAELTKKKELVPISLMIFKRIGRKESKKPLRVLFDSGGAKTMIHSRAIPKGATVNTDRNAKPCTTVSGTYNANQTVILRDGVFPEFDRHRRFDNVTATVFHEPSCAYDVIIGRDLLHNLGIIIDFANQHVKWMDKFIFMKPKTHFHHHTNWTMTFDAGVLDILDDIDDAFIMDAKYEATSAKEVADHQEHLSDTQRQQLAQALKNTTILFDGQLGHSKLRKYTWKSKMEQFQFIPRRTQYLRNTRLLFSKNLSTYKVLECWKKEVYRFGPRQLSSSQRKMDEFDGLVISEN